MTEKRFTVHIVFSNLEKTEGEIELKDNGQPLLLSESIDDVRYLKDLLNCLNDENEEFKKALIELKEIGDYQDGRIKELSDENEQLKKDVEYYKTERAALFEYLDKKHDLKLELKVEK